jgi:V/A-type H+-transporting ATPase subunit I
MAIARLLKAEIVTVASGDERLIDALKSSRLIHIEDIHENLDAEYSEMEKAPGNSSSDADAGLRKAEFLLEAFSSVSPVHKGLLESFFGSPPYVSEPDFKDALDSLDLSDYEARIKSLTEEKKSISSRIERIGELTSLLAPWARLDVTLSSLQKLTAVVSYALFGTPGQISALLSSAAEAQWMEVDRDEKRVAGLLFAIKSEAAAVADSIRKSSLEPIALPDFGETPAQALVRLDNELSELHARDECLRETLKTEAMEKRRAVSAHFDELDDLKKSGLVTRKFFYTNHALVVRGWIREADRQAFEDLAADRYPDAEVRLSQPQKGDAPPVRLENPRFLRPFQSLIGMFGLPPYTGIDPTWFLAIAMSLFYAVCLGDAGYGAMQILICMALLRRFRPAEGTRLFLQLFMRLGAGACIFGVLTWSFFGMSPGYTPGGPKILGLLPLFTPTTDILIIIAFGAGVGVVFQLGSILLGFYASLKNGDKAGAYLDKLAWFFFLLGIIICVGFLAGILPLVVGIVGLMIFVAGGSVILLSAGRHSKSIVGRLATGVISFYGILGYYGIVSFFGDVLSYLRIAVLNLTGGFIAFVANTLGQLLMGRGSAIIVAVSLLAALAPMMFFHALNLVLSMIGAFVHSLRLNYLESFSRYFTGGGRAFTPLMKEGRYQRFER